MAQVIRFSQIRNEFGGTPTTRLRSYYGSGPLVNANVLGVPTSGTISLGVFRGKTKVKGIVDNTSTTAQTNAVGVYHFKLCIGNYVGPVVKVRRSDNQIGDFFANVSGTLGTAVFGTGQNLSSWLNGLQGYVHTWYDQSGRGKHITQATSASQPLIKLDGSNWCLYLNGSLQMNGPNVFDTATVSDAHIICQLKEISRTFNFLINFNGNVNASPGRFSLHSPWVDGVWYFDPADAGNNRAFSTANITAVNTLSFFSGYKSSTDGKNGFRVNRGTRYLSTSTSAATVSGGIKLNSPESGSSINHYIYGLVVFNSKLSTTDENIVDTI